MNERKKLNGAVKMLGDLLSGGKKPNAERAFSYYKLAAEEGDDPEAQYTVAGSYATGDGVGKDFMLAAYWFGRAARHGYENADKFKQKATLDYINGQIGGWTPRALFDAAMNFRERVDGDNDVDAVNDLLSRFFQFYMGKDDYGNALKICLAMAMFGDCGEGQHNLGVMYKHQYGMPESPDNLFRALYWFDVAADKGNGGGAKQRDDLLASMADAVGKDRLRDDLRRLAVWSENGENGLPANPKKSADWRKVADALS